MNGRTPHTVTALKRWSCQEAQLPPVDKVEALHIYDFDNTLFCSPLPNKQLWNTATYGQLQAQDFLYKGGWWHNSNILAATGKGIKVEEARAWEGSWNEKIVELVRLSMEDPHALNVLLTGRSEAGFAELLGKMLASKGLTFHMVCLKPASSPTGEVFPSTMHFKQALLRELIFTYPQAHELRIYEDRPKHVKAFRDFFSELNASLLSPSNTTNRSPLTAEVIQVSEQDSFMDPAAEVAEVQKMINVNNRAVLDRTAPRNKTPYKIHRTVFYTGYLISQADSDRLRTLVPHPSSSPSSSGSDIRYLANNILITPRPAPRHLLTKVGGIGHVQRWKVTGIGHSEHKIWAARVTPIPSSNDTSKSATVHTDNHTPCVVLATRRGARPADATRIHNWQPVSAAQAFEFDGTVGEKVLLRIEPETIAGAKAGLNEYGEGGVNGGKVGGKRGREEDGFEGRSDDESAFPALGSGSGRSGFKGKPQGRFGGQGGAGGGWGGVAGRSGGGGFRGGMRNGAGGGGGRGGGRNGGGGRGGGGAGGNRGGGRGRGSYRSLDDNVGQGYGSGGMQY